MGSFAQSLPNGRDDDLTHAALRSDFNPRNITYIPAVKILACLDLEQNTPFLDGHSLETPEGTESTE